MLKMKISRIFFVFAVYSYHIVNAQDPEFTQFYAAPLYLNPSFAGSVGCSRMALNYRNERIRFPSEFMTFHLSYDQYVHHLRGGVGFISYYDIAGAGVISTFYIGSIYSPRFIIKDKLSVKPSIETEYLSKQIDWDKSYFTNNSGKSTTTYFDLSTGILIHDKKFYGGFVLNHIFESLLLRKYTFHLGYGYQKDQYSKFTFSPNIIYQRQQDFQQINLGLYAGWNKIIVGTWYGMAKKNSDAFIAMLSIRYKKIRVGYSYDITISKLSNANAGSHEITLGYLFNCKNKEDKIIALETIAF